MEQVALSNFFKNRKKGFAQRTHDTAETKSMFLMIRNTRVFILVSLIGVLFLSSAQGQPYPNRDITFIVPYGPGGSTDPVSRQFASQLEQAFNVNVSVENKPGGSAIIGTAAVFRAKPDGYTLGLTSNSVLSYQPLVNKGLAWKDSEDYQSIVKLVDLPTILAVRADSPWQTFEDFMDAVRKNPGKIRAAVSGYRTTPDLAVQELNKVAQVKIATIPFTGGGGEALVALLGGRVEASTGSAPTMAPHVQAGKIRVIASFTKDKYFAFPQATSVVQAGYNVTLPASYGIVAPKGMPSEIKDKIIATSLAIGNSPEFAQFAQKHGLILDVKGPKQMDEEMDEYTKSFRELIVYMDQKK